MPVVKSFFDAYSGLGMPERAGLLAGSTVSDARSAAA